MRIARLGRLDALYGSSMSAQTFEAAGQLVLNPGDFGGVIDVNIAKDVGVLNPPNPTLRCIFGERIRRCEQR